MSTLIEKPRQYTVCHHVEIVTILSKRNSEYMVSWRCARCKKEFVPKENK